MKRVNALIIVMMILPFLLTASPAGKEKTDLWGIYHNVLKQAKYVDLTRAFHPNIPVWPGFGGAAFKPAIAGQDYPGYAKKGDAFEYDKHGFIASAYFLPTDQYGTQLDPPGHFYKYGATISDLPATYSIRPLVVIDIHEKVKKDPGYHATLEDIKAWEAKYSPIPEGSVVVIRSDWYQKWQGHLLLLGLPSPWGGLAVMRGILRFVPRIGNMENPSLKCLGHHCPGSRIRSNGTNMEYCGQHRLRNNK